MNYKTKFISKTIECFRIEETSECISAHRYSFGFEEVYKQHKGESSQIQLDSNVFFQCCIILFEIDQHNEEKTISKNCNQKGIKVNFQSSFPFRRNLQKRIQESQQLYPIQNLNNRESYSLSPPPKLNNQHIEKANILSYIQMTQVNLDSLLFQVNTSNQQFLHILSLFVISLYFTSTESRFIEQIFDPSKFTEAENYLSRTLELVYLYFPKDMPFVNQLLNVNNRFHDISKQIIQEDVHQKHEQNYEIVLLKPILEPQKCGFVIAIISK